LFKGVSSIDSTSAGEFSGDGWIDLVVVNSQLSKIATLSVLFNDLNR
jgi:hypothetical protein